MAGEHGDAAVRLHLRTPLIESTILSNILGCQVLLKLENAQPTTCFKIRGIGNMLHKATERGYRQLVASSGGNAGLAAAYAARKLDVPITVYVPKSTPEFMRDRIKMEKANVVVHGEAWDDANARAMEDAKNPNVFNIHPFNHPDIWEGHATMIKEIHEEMTEKPDLVITSVGGGGLLLGLLKGLEDVGWGDVPTLGMETEGADCFNAAVKADQIVTLPAITSIAKCLGALTVCPELFKQYKSGKPILSELVTDKECLQTCIDFLDDHKILVEPACGAAIAAIYAGTLKRMQKEGKLGELRRVVVIVCGGLGSSVQQMEIWKQQIGLV